MLDFKDVSYSYKKAYENANVLHGVNLTVAPGERVCIVGANGSGKSTLLRLANGTIRPSSGYVLLNEQPILDLGSVELHRHVGLVRQDPTLQIVSSLVWDEVCFGPQNIGLDAEEISQRCTDALICVGLAQYKQRSTYSLSGGEQQRLALASVLAMQPEYMLLDEITTHLDLVSRQSVREIIDGLVHSGMGVVEVSHYVQDIQKADKVVLLEHGCVTWQGMPYELLQSSELLQRSCLVGASTLSIHGDESSLKSVVAARPLSTPVLQAKQVGVDGVIHNASLEIYKGDMQLIAGKSGAGKSTLAQVLAGLIEPDAGEVTYVHAEVKPGDVGLAFQRTAEQLFCDTVLEDVMFGPLQQGLSESEAHKCAIDALQLLSIDATLFERSPFDVSGGQARRVALAGILALQTEVFIFDEPTAGLDARGREELRCVVSELCNKGHAVIVVTHDIEEWLTQATKVMLLDDGCVIWSGAACKARHILSQSGLILGERS
ncbi:ABC transporter ATP-binding protein [Atopobium fossor]|uniref:ABC transporter ATP-binding protein n=1 Tax=Atopobium fossor TaxID=39487 RepID=UPI0004271D0E|nr:energy-coupling factor transporter ATPase [Atopobium fossor]